MAADEAKGPRRLPEWARIGGVCLLWGVVGAALFLATVYLDLGLNFFDWSPTVEWPERITLGVGALTLVGSLFLGGITRGRIATTVAVLVVLGLAGFGLYLLPAETLSPDTFLGRDLASPLWYRGSRALVLLFPGVFLVLRLIGRRRD